MSRLGLPRTLRHRLALWIGLSTTLALVVFATATYLIVLVEEHDEPPATAAASEPEDAGDEAVEVLTAMAFAAPVGLALAVLGSSWLTRRALAPIDLAVRAAAEISAERLDRRLPEPERDDEVRALVQALNHLLARLDRGYAELGRFAADASHELRTPLAVVASELEVALRRPRTPAEWQVAAQTSLDELRRLTHLVDALLRLARADALRPEAGERVDLAALLDQAVAQQAPSAARPTIIIATGAEPPLVVQGDREALGSAIANLVANALRYTPPGGHVWLALERRGDRARLCVDDDGPGLGHDDLDAIFRPFTRGGAGAALPAGEVGHGLGLAIARRIAEAHRGQVAAEPSPRGGARFTLDLPVAAPLPAS